MFTETVDSEDTCLSLLAEVDFKWLMAGHGEWIDLARLHDDASYAAALFSMALASPSFALRECAALLQAINDRRQTT